MEVTYVNIDLYTLDSSGKSAIVMSGMRQALISYFNTMGHSYEIEDKRTPIPDVDVSILPELREGQDKIFGAILTEHNGIIVAPPAMGKTFIIEQLCRLYKDQKILISTPRAAVLKDIFRRVSKTNSSRKVELVMAGKEYSDKAEVIVCSSKSLHKIDTDWPDIILFDEVHNAAAPELCKVLSSFDRARMFGFSASPKGRSDGADLMTEALFGHQICKITYKEAQGNNAVTPIDVYVVDVTAPEIIRTQPVSRERYNIWRNRVRNNKVADIVAKFSKDTQILILVNTAEHAYTLRQYMPDFTVVHAGMTPEKKAKFVQAGICTKEDELVPDKDEMLKQFQAGTLKRVISTAAWREGVDVVQLAVLIRCDGTKGPIPAIQIGGRLSRVSSDKSSGMLIDFTDRFGRTFEERSKNRVRNYVKQGWVIHYDEPQGF